MKIGIVGCGVVGSALLHLFKTNGLDVCIYDKYKIYVGYQTWCKNQINQCDYVFICVPTPFKNGKVDISAVEECVSWIKAPNIIIKSTVPPGTTRKLAEKYKKRIFHNPEFLREKTAKEDIFHEGRIIIGVLNEIKDNEIATVITDIIFGCMKGDILDSVIVPAEISELVKYATNAFLATKVAFCNEMDIIAKKFGIDWNSEFREYWLLDKRINPSHTWVTEERGFGGNCLVKDLDGLIGFSHSKFFKAVKEQNERTKKFRADK